MLWQFKGYLSPDENHVMHDCVVQYQSHQGRTATFVEMTWGKGDANTDGELKLNVGQ